jgi:hypothetical protein
VVHERAENTTGLLTFCLLWVMRISTKLNIYLGARHAISDMLPDRLSYLKSYFRTDRTSGWFYVSLSAARYCWAGWSHAAAAAATDHAAVKWTLLACFAALALLEHLFLVLPVRDSALWAGPWNARQQDEITANPGQFGRKSLKIGSKTIPSSSAGMTPGGPYQMDFNTYFQDSSRPCTRQAITGCSRSSSGMPAVSPGNPSPRGRQHP